MNIDLVQPTMHCHAELEKDLSYDGFLSNDLMLKWFNDRYSTSKHLLSLYSLVRGLNAKNVLEIGFGRSTFVLAKAVSETGGLLTSCDKRDFSYLLSQAEVNVTTFVNDYSPEVWLNHTPDEGFDFAFLDYFSDEKLEEDFIKRELKSCIHRMKTNGVIAIHDTIIDKYALKAVLNSIKANFWNIHNVELEVLSLPYNYGLGLIRVLKESKLPIIEDQFLKKPEN